MMKSLVEPEDGPNPPEWNALSDCNCWRACRAWKSLPFPAFGDRATVVQPLLVPDSLVNQAPTGSSGPKRINRAITVTYNELFKREIHVEQAPQARDRLPIGVVLKGRKTHGE
jgi:hypothetical protein